jgi:GAF domain-containing protein
VVQNSDRLRERLETLRLVSRALARPLAPVGVLRAVHAEMARVLDTTICFFGLFDAASQTVEVIWQVHDGVELPGGHFPLGSGPTSQAIRECRPQLIRRWSTQGPRVQVQYATERAGLPESSIVAPVVVDNHVLGILALQSYQPEKYDQDDLALVQDIADHVAVAMAAVRRRTESTMDSADLEPVLASMPDALLVLDDEGRLVRLNQAARRLLSTVDGAFIFGQPVDRPQADQWPLGTRALTEQLLPIVDQLKHGDAPTEEVELALAQDHKVGCRASVLLKDGTPAGGLMLLRELK